MLKKKKFKNYLKILIIAFLILATIQSSLVILQFSKQHFIGLNKIGEINIDPTVYGIAKIDLINGKFIRPSGTLPHPNLLGAFLLISTISCLLLIYKQNLLKLYPIFYLNFIAIILTFSRSGIFCALAAISVLTFYYLFFWNEKLKIKILNILILIFWVRGWGTVPLLF